MSICPTAQATLLATGHLPKLLHACTRMAHSRCGGLYADLIAGGQTRGLPPQRHARLPCRDGQRLRGRTLLPNGHRALLSIGRRTRHRSRRATRKLLHAARRRAGRKRAHASRARPHARRTARSCASHGRRTAPSSRPRRAPPE
uniref:Uncharacterized protein n=1 Tax=Arundo donax TaxID=35708 RepID=A0A0A9H5X2_ARUDO